jgi:hypothetical protein
LHARKAKRCAKHLEKEGMRHTVVTFKSAPVVIRSGTSTTPAHRSCGGGCEFITQDGKHHQIDGTWDLLIAHPPCTFLAVAGNSWFAEGKYFTKAKSRYMDRVDGIRFFMEFVSCNAKRICIENPIGIMSNVYRKPNQIIHPYMFGHATRKATCLWLTNLPELKPTDIVEPEIIKYKNGKGTDDAWHMETIGLPKAERQRLRSKTFKGIAQAMAEQWG